MTKTLEIAGYTVTAHHDSDATFGLAYSLDGPRGSHFDVIRDRRSSALWAINLKRSGYLPTALRGNLARFEVQTTGLSADTRGE